ncbi:AAA family ATPase [Variovorax sp. YR216]|uniref:ATP-binding protein n=1 Tax=Variovorax sp. YR216 TaxID=1882828 RepID=UPI0008989224|nr:AAA family ATPase [Variovorax sp. YR216]SEB16079.1 Adenylate and Guanylate cyclase catalytic domain-containing protein [Variovorax sp. YR216]
MTIRSVCVVCHHSNRKLARFCERCGERLPQSARPSIELRQGTVVFCDLVGSGALSMHLDSDALVDLYGRYWRFVSETTKRYSGYVNRTEGDGAFLLFGYPAGGEDAAECALRTALELVRDIAARIQVAGEPLALRVGAASGTIVMAGAIEAATNRELALLGPVPDRAHRLQSLASASAILIDAETRRLAGEFFAYRELGPHTLKNVDRPVQVWEAVGETAVVSRFEARHHDEAAQVMAPIGRDEELQQIRDCWQTVQSGDGRIVWVSGEPGIGKSSLARYFAAKDLSSRGKLLEMHCVARSERSPLFPVGVLLRSQAGIHVTDGDEERLAKAHAFLGAIVPEERLEAAMGLAAGLLGLPPPAEHAAMEPDALRERTIALLCEVLVSFAQRGPTVLCVEDLHWADATTLGLLARVAKAAGGLPMLLLLTSRFPPAATSHFDAALLAHCTRIELQPLDDAHAAMIARRAASQQPLSDEQIAAVVARAEGLPLVIEELAYDALHQADLGAMHSGEPHDAKDRVPAILKTIVQSRMDRSPSVVPIIHAASVIGREVSLQLMMNAATDAPDVPSALAEVIDLGLLNQEFVAGVPVLRFRHGLIQEAVYDSMMASRQKELHSRVADLLRSGLGTADECTPDALAHHLLSAERFAEGVRCLYEAAVATASRAAYLESRAYAEQGLQWVASVPQAEERAQLKLLLLSIMGAALSAVLGYGAPEVEQTYREAHSICSEGGDATALFPIARGLAAFYFVRGQMTTAGALAAQCMDLAAKANIPDFEVEALSFRGYTDCYLGETRKGRAALESAIRIGKTLEHPFRYTSPQHPVTAALAFLGNTAWAQGDADTAEAVVQEALTFAQGLQRPFDLAYVHGWAAGLRNLQRRWDEAQMHAQQCYAASEKFGLRIWLATATMQGCIAAVSKAPAPEALAMLQGALQGFLMAGAEVNSGYFRWGIARGQRMAGDPDSARATVAEALEHVERTDESFIRGELLILAAELDSDPARIDRLLLEAMQEGIDINAPTLALRAGLLLLRHRGLTSDDPQRDLAAQLALDGQVLQTMSVNWIHEAWAGVRAAIPDIAMDDATALIYQRSPSSMDSTIEH